MKSEKVLKPKISQNILKNWQRIVDLMAGVSGATAGFIMKIHAEESIDIFVVSEDQNNLNLKVGDKALKGTGTYCEEVIKCADMLLIRDATKNAKWCEKISSANLGMSFYLGFPLFWPDGEIFGTICVLDVTENQQEVAYKDLIFQFKKIVDTDLKMLVEIETRKQAQRELLNAHTKLESCVAERTCELQEANTALRVLIKNHDQAKEELEASMLANINELIIPYMQCLKKNKTQDEKLNIIGLIQSALDEITSSFSSHLTQKYKNLTPTEMQVINLIRQKKTTKEIANHLNTATSTIDFHRTNIRKKMGLTNKRKNLQTHVMTEPS